MGKKRFKRGYFYTLDVVFAIIILVIGLLLVAGSYFYAPQKVKSEALANDITGVLGSTHIYDVCNDIDSCDCSYQSIRDLCNENPSQIKNPDITLLEFMGQLYHDNQREAIQDIVNETIVKSYVLPPNYDMQVVLFDPKTGDLEQLYPLVT